MTVGAEMSRFVHHRLGGKLMRYLTLGFALVSGIVVTVQALRQRERRDSLRL